MCVFANWTLSDFESIATILSPVVMWILYEKGWRKFLRKKEVDKMAKNAEQAIAELTVLEGLVRYLFRIVVIRYNEDINKDAQRKIHLATQKLIDRLRLIKKDYQVPDVLKQIIKILYSNFLDPKTCPLEKSIKVVEEIDPSTKEVNLSLCTKKEINIEKLEAIKEELRDIYHNPEKHLKK